MGVDSDAAPALLRLSICRQSPHKRHSKRSVTRPLTLAFAAFIRSSPINTLISPDSSSSDGGTSHSSRVTLGVSNGTHPGLRSTVSCPFFGVTAREPGLRGECGGVLSSSSESESVRVPSTRLTVDPMPKKTELRRRPVTLPRRCIWGFASGPPVVGLERYPAVPGRLPWEAAGASAVPSSFSLISISSTAFSSAKRKSSTADSFFTSTCREGGGVNRIRAGTIGEREDRRRQKVREADRNAVRMFSWFCSCDWR